MTLLITFLALTGLICWIFILMAIVYIYLEK
jgi:hypothetical protein